MTGGLILFSLERLSKQIKTKFYFDTKTVSKSGYKNVIRKLKKKELEDNNDR